MLGDVVVTSHMLPGASNSEATLLQVAQSMDTREVSWTTSSRGLVKPYISFLLSFNCLLPSLWTPTDFTHPLRCNFLGQLFHFFHSTCGPFDEKSLSDASLCCGNKATSTFMTQQITALWLQGSFLSSCCPVVDLNSNLYASSRVVQRGRKVQMNRALGQELGYNFHIWQSSSDGCSLFSYVYSWVFFID